MKSITHHTEENRNKRRFIRIINIGIITILIMLLVHGFNTTYAEFSCSALTESNQTIERQDELFGVKNEEGNWIILPQWSSIRSNGEGTYLVFDSIKGKYGLFREDGFQVFDAVWDYIYRVSEGRVFCGKFDVNASWVETTVSLFDIEGQFIKAGFLGGWGEPELCYVFEDGISSVHTELGDYYVNRDGDRISDFYEYASGFTNGYAIIKQDIDTDYYMIDHSFNRIELPNDYCYSSGPSGIMHYGVLVFLEKDEKIAVYSLIENRIIGQFDGYIEYSVEDAAFVFNGELDDENTIYYKIDYNDGSISQISYKDILDRMF